MKEILNLTIYGQPYVEEESKDKIFHNYLKKNIIVYSANYTAWRKDSLLQLGMCNNGYLQKKIDKEIDYPVTIKYNIFLKKTNSFKLSDYAKQIEPLLVEAKILKNLKIVINNDNSKIFYNCESPKVIIWILKK